MSEIAHPHDTALPMTDVDLQIFDRVDTVLEEALEGNNPMLIFRFGMALRKAAQTSGLGLAKLLYDGRQIWDEFDSDDDFATVAKTQMGISDETYNKYIRVWEFVINHPYLINDHHLRGAVMRQPIRGLILLTAAAREDQLEPKHWEQIAKAPNVAAIREIVSEVRGYRTSAKSRLTIMIQKDGVIRVRIGEGNFENKGLIKRDGSPESEALLARMESAGALVEAK